MIEVALIAVAGVVALALVEKTPAILAAIADVRIAGRRDLDGLMPIDEAIAEVSLGVQTAIRRADPTIPDELVERMAVTVIEDLRDGVLGPLEPESGE